MGKLRLHGGVCITKDPVSRVPALRPKLSFLFRSEDSPNHRKFLAQVFPKGPVPPAPSLGEAGLSIQKFLAGPQRKLTKSPPLEMMATPPVVRKSSQVPPFLTAHRGLQKFPVQPHPMAEPLHTGTLRPRYVTSSKRPFLATLPNVIPPTSQFFLHSTQPHRKASVFISSFIGCLCQNIWSSRE